MSLLRYLQRHAEPEAGLLDDFPPQRYRQVLCLPAHDENDAFLASLQTAAASASGKTLLILVINRPDNRPPCDNDTRLYSCIAGWPASWRHQHLALHHLPALDVLLVDRFSSQPIIASQGVGLARKIAADIACALWQQGNILCPAFFSSDADVIFPADYFSATLPDNSSAACLAFRHQPGEDAAINRATQLYEQSLHAYVNGLKRAGSTYAWHSIGSCLLINFDSYIKVRGFPRRAAAEDFYLLNKLQKIRPVQSLDRPLLLIHARSSQRVPFGTGPAVQKWLQDPATAGQWFFPDHCFTLLGEWLAFLQQLAMAGQWLPPGQPELEQLASQSGLRAALPSIFSGHRQPETRQKQLDDWFDAFRTVKLLRQLRQQSMNGHA